MKTKIYETGKTKNGRRVVLSGTPLEWFVYGIVKWTCKAIFFCMFFWIIIPVKIYKKFSNK